MIEAARHRTDGDGVLGEDAMRALAEDLALDVQDVDRILADAGWSDLSEVDI